MSATAPKRRRRSTDSAADVVPSEVVSSHCRSSTESATGGDAEAGTTAEVSPGVELVQPDLKDIPKLVLVELQKDDVDVVATALCQLGSLMVIGIVNRKENQKDAIRFGAVAVVLGAMCQPQWQMHEGVQSHSCICLGNLSYMSNHGSELIARSGGIEAVVNVMKVFSNNVQINMIAAIALNNLFCVDTVRTAFSRRFVENMNGLKLLVNTMSNFQANNQINKSCCVIFYRLAMESDLREAIVKAGVVSSVASAMERHLEDQNVKEPAEFFMTEMYAGK